MSSGPMSDPYEVLREEYLKANKAWSKAFKKAAGRADTHKLSINATALFWTRHNVQAKIFSAWMEANMRMLREVTNYQENGEKDRPLSLLKALEARCHFERIQEITRDTGSFVCFTKVEIPQPV